MSTNFLTMLRREIESLEAALAATPTYMRLKAAREVLALYESEPQEPPQELPQTPARITGRSVSEARDKALRIAEEMLKGRMQPTPTREILAHVNERGVKISGKDPVSNMSAMLSQSALFQPNGRAGWTLVAQIRDDAHDSSTHVGRVPFPSYEEAAQYDEDRDEDEIEDEIENQGEDKIEDLS